MDERAVEQSARKRGVPNFVLRAVDAMHPDYLAIGVESNMLLSRNQAKWQQLKELQRDTYTAVKKVHRMLPFFLRPRFIHYKGLTRDSKGTDQEKEVADMMRSSDLFAMSLYPHMSAEMPRVIPANFLEFAKRFKKRHRGGRERHDLTQRRAQVVRDDALRFRSGPGAVR